MTFKKDGNILSKYFKLTCFLFVLIKSVDDWKKRRREKQKPRLSNDTQNDLNVTQQASTQFNLQSTSLINFKINQQPNIKTKSSEQKTIQETSISVSPKIIPKLQSPSKLSKTNQQQLVKNEEQIKEQEGEEEEDEENVDYIQKEIRIVRPFDHPTRGFGFLINKNTNKKYAQIVVVEQDSLADKAGLEKNDKVLEINSNLTENLNNEQLRKIMRERLQQNSVDLIILRALINKGKSNYKYRNIKKKNNYNINYIIIKHIFFTSMLH